MDIHCKIGQVSFLFFVTTVLFLHTHSAHNKKPQRHRTKIADITSIWENQVPFPEDLEEDVRRSLEKMHHSYNRPKGSSFEFKCKNTVTNKIMKSFPKAKYRWIHNGFLLKMEHVESGRKQFVNGSSSLIIRNLVGLDTGVYLCQMEYAPYQVKTVGVFSLFVKDTSMKEMTVYLGTTFAVQCHSSPIGYVYPYAKRTWYVNGKIYSVLQNIQAKNVGADFIKNTQKYMAGEWKCVVHDDYSDKSWITATYRIRTRNPPSVIWNVINYFAKNKIHLATLCIGLVCFALTLAVSFFKQRQKRGDILSSTHQQLDEAQAEGVYSDDDYNDTYRKG